MERIAVIGNAGGGKSTLARKLAARHGLRRASEIVFIGVPLQKSGTR